ncbi:MAG: tRNA epoxyqueuosine(34) reductase QueG [Magnetococcales bacterium]|nr:tRNA epoxyqueuosine(34) reductase QueG [Magnetococcales bacterium]MBF0323106.1 tRNA epoxyqueuosine(34) reductase QueG [Magnetococcales bacterium]
MPLPDTPWHQLKEQLRRQALSVGFDVAGFAPPVPPPHAADFPLWLAQGCHGDMTWMERYKEQRQNPRLLLTDVASILVVGANYRPKGDPLDYLENPAAMGISAYARHRDYHTVLKKRLQTLHHWLEQQVGQPVPARLFVDTAPVLEKPLAVLAGLGWQGKNTMLVNRQFGCWLFLAEMFLTLPFPPDAVEPDHCGTCHRCQDACPTGALAQPYRLDAHRCLAYMTIESKENMPEHYQRLLGNRVYGCDDCVALCPFNRFAPVSEEEDYHPQPPLLAPKLADFTGMDEKRFQEIFRQSPIKRLGRERFLRNLGVAINNERRAAKPRQALDRSAKSA